MISCEMFPKENWGLFHNTARAEISSPRFGGRFIKHSRLLPLMALYARFALVLRKLIIIDFRVLLKLEYW